MNWALAAGNTIYYLHFTAFYFLVVSPFIITNLVILRGLLLLTTGALISRFMLGGCLIGHFENTFFTIAGVNMTKTDMITKFLQFLYIPVSSETKFWLPNIALFVIMVGLAIKLMTAASCN